MSTKIDVLSELASRLTKKGDENLKILTNDGAGLPVIDNAVRNRSEAKRSSA